MVTAAGGVTEMLLDTPWCAPTCWTKAGTTATAEGTPQLDGADAGPVPTALVAATVNVYAVPLVNPVTVVVVAGGFPDTVTGVCAVDPTNGVTT